MAYLFTAINQELKLYSVLRVKFAATAAQNLPQGLIHGREKSIGILRYGKKFTLKEILTWIKTQ